MSNKKILIVDQELMGRIEENRDNLSRADFVDLCIDTYLDKKEEKPQELEKESRENYVTKQEFKDFKNDIRNLFHSFIKFFFNFEIGLGKKEEKEPEKLRERLQDILSEDKTPPQGKPAQAKGQEEDPPKENFPSKKDTSHLKVLSSEVEDTDHLKEGGLHNLYSLLWIPAILLFGFGDTFTSTFVFSQGGNEANPLLVNLMNLLGGGILSFVLLKTFILTALALLSFSLLKKSGWIIPCLLSVVGGYLVASNLSTLIGL